MAIYHHPAKIIKRSEGRSAVGASAYRSAEKIRNEYDGLIHDYTNKKGVVYKDILLPNGASEKFKNREYLWNKIEQRNKRCDAQLAREIEVGLPNEFSKEENIELLKDYVNTGYISYGMIADIAMHDKGDGNPHAHILLTMRDIKNGDDFGNQNRKWNDYLTKEFYNEKRILWQDKVNEAYKTKGLDIKVDCRSYEEQGIDKIPTKHLGVVASNMKKKGKKTRRGEDNREMNIINDKKTTLDEKIKLLEKNFESLDTEKRALEVVKLKNDFIRLGKEKSQSSKQEQEKIQADNREKAKKRELLEYRDLIIKYDNQLEQLKGQLEQINILDLTARDNIKRQIQMIENSKYQVSKNLQSQNLDISKLNKELELIQMQEKRSEGQQKKENNVQQKQIQQLQNLKQQQIGLLEPEKKKKINARINDLQKVIEEKITPEKLKSATISREDKENRTR